MHSPKSIPSLLIVCALALNAEPANPLPKSRLDAHRASMDQSQDLQYDIKDSLDAKDTAKIIAPADELLKLCIQEEQFWSEAGLDRARAIAKVNREAVQQLVSAAKAGDLGAAGKADGQVQESCRSCHDQHFEKQIETR